MQHLQITLDKSALHMNSSTLHENSCYFGLFTCNLLSPYDTSLDFPTVFAKDLPQPVTCFEKRENTVAVSFLRLIKNHQITKIVNKIYVQQNANWNSRKDSSEHFQVLGNLCCLVYSFSKYSQIIPRSPFLWVWIFMDTKTLKGQLIVEKFWHRISL